MAALLAMAVFYGTWLGWVTIIDRDGIERARLAKNGGQSRGLLLKTKFLLALLILSACTALGMLVSFGSGGGDDLSSDCWGRVCE